MMKEISIFLFLIFSASFCVAQNEALLIDEQGKFIHYELIDAKGLSKNQLKETVSSFFKKPYKDLKLRTSRGDTSFLACGKLIISKTVMVISHPSGEILFDFQTEVKEDKYRFWLTNFSFVPYQRDRYGNFVAATTKGIPLENNPGKLNLSQWKEYQAQTAKYAYQFAKDFKGHMVGKTSIAIPAKEKSVVKKEW